MIKNRERAGARRDLRVGAQHGDIGVPAIECRERPGSVGVGHDLELQPRGIVLQHGSKSCGEARLRPVGIGNRKHKRLGIPQPDPAAPDGRRGQDHREDGEQDDLRAVALDDARARRGISGSGARPSALMAHTRSRDIGPQ